MGSRFEITAFADNQQLADEGVRNGIAEIRRIESFLSEYNENSEVSLINKNAGIQAVKVDIELFRIIERCIKISELTDGAFDITWASSGSLWKFDGSQITIPSDEEIGAILSIIGYRNIILNSADTSVLLKNKGMKIGFGAIGKGYAANKARDVMINTGIESGIVIAGGDLITWGKQDSDKPWTIGIANPVSPNHAIAWINIQEGAVVTSGNYEKYIIIDNTTYTHIIDPRTCRPVRGLQSVTIICPDAELADALATAVFVMGKDEGLFFINQLKGIECIIIDDSDQISTSDGIILNYYQAEEKQKQHNITIGN